MSKGTKELIATMAVGALTALLVKYALEPVVLDPVKKKIEQA